MIKRIKSAIKKIIPKSVIKNFSQLNGPLCYHSISNTSMEGIVAHRISKINFACQLRKLKSEGYTFLPIDEYLQTKTKSRITSITFDDGYRDIYSNAAEVLIDEQIPFTLFLNGCLLSSKILWRDMIRIVIKSRLEEEFYHYLLTRNEELAKVIDCSDFYRSTKVNQVNSKALADQLSSFLMLKGAEITDDSKYVTVKQLEALPKDLFTLGNHTTNHYRLSTLTYDQLYSEIKGTHELIHEINCEKSHVFSIPFGGNDSFNQDFIDILFEFDYTGFLTTDSKPFSPLKYGLNIGNLNYSSRILPKDEPRINI